MILQFNVNLELHPGACEWADFPSMIKATLHVEYIILYSIHVEYIKGRLTSSDDDICFSTVIKAVDPLGNTKLSSRAEIQRIVVRYSLISINLRNVLNKDPNYKRTFVLGKPSFISL